MKKFFTIVFILSSISNFGQDNNQLNNYIVERFIDSTGKEVVGVLVPGKPPDKFRMPVSEPTKASYSLSNVPGYDWSFGCSATSAAMMAGYYDRTGFPNMYTGPTNGGIAPMDNSVWGSVVINGETRKQCPLSATRNGLDGRTSRGHVDDYWVSYEHPGPDPYITNGWTQHTYGDCAGDYMKTNQSAFGNTDGSTWFFYYTNGSPYSGTGSNNNDGMYGIKLFFESRGYTVTSHYNQLIGGTPGFTFNQFKQEINAGRPVLIQVTGHTMLGYGYNETGNIVYLMDTWDYASHQMTWGGSYAGYSHYMVGIISLQLIACTPPASQATVFTSSAITNTTMTTGWTRGNGTGGVIVVARAGIAVNADPVNGNTYTANAAFGSGTQIGPGNYVVYTGTGTSVSVTSLTSGTAYHYAVYEYNTTGTCYKTPALTGNVTTTCTPPTNPATAFTSSAITNTTMTTGWTRGSGSGGVIVVARAGSTINADPVIGATYTANAAFGSGSQIGTGNYVVYIGIGTSVNVSALTGSTTYHYAIYEYNTPGTCY
ncbi:MAG: hypothetical protein U1C46_07755, partial [Bacteroidales bacterium]|nr:hypothetical protein [Bacteroidales bacterium]